MRERNTTNISSELNTITDQIKYFEELEYEDGFNVYCNGAPYPFLGVDEEDFYKIRNKVVEMLKECFNKKNSEMIKFCNSQKYLL